MTNQPDLTIAQKNLFQQGFQSYTRGELKSLNIGLRFTPFICMMLGIYGLITHNIFVLSSVAAIGVIAAFFPSKHPFDLLYNHVVRHITKSEALPSNPLQRRLACLGAGFMNASIAMLFLFDPTVQQITLSEVSLSMSEIGGKGQFAYYLGFFLISMQIIVFANHFCALSWGYEKLMKMMGLAEAPVSAERAAKFNKMGARIIDVRNENAYSQKHIKGAINIPLENLQNSKVLSQLSDEIVLIYCHTGKLSHIAQELLRKNGISLSYNLGGIERANTILAS